MTDSTTEYEQERRGKLAKLRELGLDPFGQRTAAIVLLATARSKFDPTLAPDAGPRLTVAGRVMLKRDMGKLTFMSLRDESGDLQIGLDKKRLSERDWQVNNLLDLGDQVVVTGRLGATKKGEPTIWAGLEPIADGALTMGAKALLPPPAKWEGLSNVEARYRQRYVDLFANPEVMQTLKLRIAIVDAVRQYMKDQGYLEVETPMLQPIHGGAAARPFKTHHNALDLPLYLRIAPELYLKRLLVGGFRKVFEINRNFRNEGISPRHNPEFTMLEAYEAFGSWKTMADLLEGMICHVAQSVLGTLKIEHADGRSIDLGTRPWPRRTMAELVAEKTGWRFVKQPIETAELDRIRAANPGKDLKHHTDPAEQLQELYEKLVEPMLINPCFVTRVPGVIIPLAKRCADDDFFADVFELAINGQEIAPGYTELNDSDKQAEHFRHQVGDQAEQQKVDEDFLTALKYAMPPAGGIGLGIDRLVMMLTGAASIRDVILFPLMRPE